LKFQLEEVVLRLPAIQGVGDPSKADGYKHSEPLPTLQMGYASFFFLFNLVNYVGCLHMNYLSSVWNS